MFAIILFSIQLFLVFWYFPKDMICEAYLKCFDNTYNNLSHHYVNAIYIYVYSINVLLIDYYIHKYIYVYIYVLQRKRTRTTYVYVCYVYIEGRKYFWSILENYIIWMFSIYIRLCKIYKFQEMFWMRWKLI